MSYIEIDPPFGGLGRRQRPQRVNQNFFTIMRQQSGQEIQRHNYAMGASWAYAVIGPDSQDIGALQTNNPTAQKPGFTSGWVGVNKPDTIFSTNRTQGGDTWVRGHMINGTWGGSGASWRNLTPLTKTANSNHETIENHMKNYLTASRRYEMGSNTQRTSWYGIQYVVECSNNPLADNNTDVATNLYAYAPEFIRVTWRAIRILKPTDRQPNQIANFLNNANLQPVANLPFQIPNFPGNLRNNGALPPGNAYGGNVQNCPVNLVNLQNNGFDGSCEINQM